MCISTYLDFFYRNSGGYREGTGVRIGIRVSVCLMLLIVLLCTRDPKFVNWIQVCTEVGVECSSPPVRLRVISYCYFCVTNMLSIPENPTRKSPTSRVSSPNSSEKPGEFLFYLDKVKTKSRNKKKRRLKKRCCWH